MSVLLEYDCPCCGGKVEFDSKLQKMKCPYCDTTFDVDAMQEHARELKQEQTVTEEPLQPEQTHAGFDEAEKEGLRVYVCRSCGGEIYTDETTAATHCPYCGNPVILKGNVSDEWKPDGVLPFRIDKKAAKEALKNHMTGKKLLDKSFASDNRLEEIKGVYLPFWLFDGTADGDVRYHATRVRTWRTRDHVCTETSHYSVHRAGSLDFHRIPVDGASQVPDDLMESVEPFDFSGIEPFQTGYLSGYYADRYNVDADKSQPRAAQRARESLEDALRETVHGYNTVHSEHSNIRMKNPTSQYVLCPVWLLTASYQGQNYLFAVNGQTGKIAGNMPLNKKARLGYTIGYTLLMGLIMNLLSLLMFEPDATTVFVSFLIGFIIALGIVGSMQKEVLNVAFQEDADAYIAPSGLILRSRSERFLYTNVTRTPIQKNNSSRKH